MSRRYLLGIAVAGLLALNGCDFAPQDPAEAQPAKPEVAADPAEPAARPAGAKPAPPEGGPFAVSPAGQSAVLLDTKSGKTWVLTRSAHGESVWLPASRIDSAQEARDWQGREDKAKQHRDALKRTEKR